MFVIPRDGLTILPSLSLPLPCLLPGRNTRVGVTRKRVHLGHTHAVSDQSDPAFGQLSADSTNNAVSQIDPALGHRVKLTDFRVIVDPAWSLAPIDPFRVKFGV